MSWAQGFADLVMTCFLILCCTNNKLKNCAIRIRLFFVVIFETLLIYRDNKNKWVQTIDKNYDTPYTIYLNTYVGSILSSFKYIL